MRENRSMKSILTRAEHLLGILLCSIVARIATAFRETVIGSFAVLRTCFAGMRARLMLEFAYRALLTLLLIYVGLIARFTVATTRWKVPFAVSLAEEGWLFDFHSVRDTSADRLFNERDLATGRRGRKMGKVHRDLGTADVIHLNG